MDGEIERAENGEDAQRPEAAFGARMARRRERRDQLQAFVGGDRGLRNAGLSFETRLPERFADVQGDGVCQLFLALLEDGADAPHQPGAVLLGEGAEPGLRLVRRLDSALDLCDSPGELAEQHGEVGWRAILDHSVRPCGVAPGSGDEVHRLFKGYRMQPLAVLRLERLDGGPWKLHFGVAKGAGRADGAEAVAALAALHRDQSFLDLGR